MAGQAMVGRMIAAVGIVCGVIAIWLKALGTTKYWDDGTLGSLLLILAIVAGLFLLGAVATNRRTYDVGAGAAGGIMLGLYLWYPALFAFDQLGNLDSGAWFGVCSALIPIGVAIAVGPSLMTAGSRPAPAGVLLALAGLVLVLVGIWTKAADTFGKYWNVPGAGHSLGILMLILVVLTAAAIAASYGGALSQDVALWISAVTLGLTVYLPVIAAFNQFGHLKVGAWLAGIGGIVLMVGVVAMRQLARADAPAPAMATPAPPSA